MEHSYGTSVTTFWCSWVVNERVRLGWCMSLICAGWMWIYIRCRRSAAGACGKEEGGAHHEQPRLQQWLHPRRDHVQPDRHDQPQDEVRSPRVGRSVCRHCHPSHRSLLPASEGKRGLKFQSAATVTACCTSIAWYFYLSVCTKTSLVISQWEIKELAAWLMSIDV